MSIKSHLNLISIGNLQYEYHIDGLVQACSNSIADALELLQSCAKPSIYYISMLSEWEYILCR